MSDTGPWVGVMIHIDSEPFTGLTYNVPGWECKSCGIRVGSIDLPPNSMHKDACPERSP